MLLAQDGHDLTIEKYGSQFPLLLWLRGEGDYEEDEKSHLGSYFLSAT
jgi:hypothetical protein